MKKATYFQPLGGSITRLLDPLLAKRSHVDAALALSWPDIAGEKLAGRTQPLKVTWPHRASQDDPFQPGALTIACEGAVALDLQYQTSELIARINRFFGYTAVARIKIEQRAIDGFRPRKAKQAQKLDQTAARELASHVANISDDGLREALMRLGASVKIQKSGESNKNA
jgi:hypothetical protein